MATYLATVNFTSQGVAKHRDTIKRAAKIRTALKKHGIEVIHMFWAMGQYDGFLLFTAADDETASAAMLWIASQGFVRLGTTRVFDEQEMAAILAKQNRLTGKNEPAR